jgi:hypothetical protein
VNTGASWPDLSEAELRGLFTSELRIHAHLRIAAGLFRSVSDKPTSCCA